MVHVAPWADDGVLGDSFSVDTAALGSVPEAACGSVAGRLGVNAVGNAVAHLVAVAGCSLDGDVRRLRTTVANPDASDGAAAAGAQRCTSALAGGWW